MGRFLAYEPKILGIFGSVGVKNAHFANASENTERPRYA